MPLVLEAIDKMSTQEKFETVNYIWSSLSRADDLIPQWHGNELRATEARVAAGIERPIPWEIAKQMLQSC